MCNLALLVQGCTATQQESDYITLIEESNLTRVESWQFSDLYDEVRVIPLETTGESLFAEVLQTVSNDSVIFVRATYSTESNDAAIWQYNANGKFLRQMGSVGQGPGEYSSISNIVLRNDTLFAFDQWNSNIHLYQVDSGKYLSSTQADSFEPLRSVNTVITIPDSYDFLFSSDIIFGDDTYGVAECNPMTYYFKRILPQKFKVSSWISYEFGYPTIASLNNEEALAIMPLDDTIYSIEYSTGQVKKFARLCIGTRAPVFSASEEFDKALKNAQEQKYNNITGIYASKNILILNRVSGSVMWDMRTHKGLYTLNGWKFSDGIGFPFFPAYIVESHEDNTFVCAYDADDYNDYSRTVMPGHAIKVAGNDYNHFDSDANNILVVYKFK